MTKEWMTDLPPELANDSVLERFEDVPSLAKSYKEQLKMISKMVKIPDSEDAEAVASFVSKVVPKSPDEYQTAEGPAKAILERVRAEATKLGIHKGAFAGLAKLINEQVKAARSDVEGAVGEWESQAKKEFGDKYAAVKENVSKFLEAAQQKDPKLKQFLESTKIAENPQLLGLLSKAASLTMNDKTPSGLPTSTGGDVRSTAARIQELYFDKDFQNRGSPRNRLLVAEFTELQKHLANEGYFGVSDPRLQELLGTPVAK